MEYLPGLFTLAAIPCGLNILGLGLVVLGFISAQEIERSFPIIENQISLALGCSIPATIVSLCYLKRNFYNPASFISLESAAYTRGWPIPWYGYNGLGLLFVPMDFCIDMLFWSLVGLIVFLTLGFIKRRLPPSFNTLLNIASATLSILSPLILTILK